MQSEQLSRQPVAVSFADYTNNNDGPYIFMPTKNKPDVSSYTANNSWILTEFDFFLQHSATCNLTIQGTCCKNNASTIITEHTVSQTWILSDIPNQGRVNFGGSGITYGLYVLISRSYNA